MTEGSNERGFTVLELALSVWVIALMAGVASFGLARVQRAGALQATQQSLLWTLRDAQVFAVAHASSTTVDLAPFSPWYTVCHGTQMVSRQVFWPGIHYVDGYLQMPAHRINYGPAGDSDNAGTIRLTDGRDVLGIRLYRGSGLQADFGDGP